MMMSRLSNGLGDEPPLTLGQMLDEYEVWVNYNFGSSAAGKAIEQFLGVVEEVGELSHALLKQNQRIRGTYEELDVKQKDAVADIFIFLAGFCLRKGWDIEDLILEAWKEVRQRDWQNYPKGGKPLDNS